MIVSENIQKVSDLIKDDLSLERIKDIKEQLSKEKSTIEYQLGKESEHYYGLVEESLSLLSVSQDSVKTIREKMQEVDKLNIENNSSIIRYEVIFNSTKLYEVIDMTSSIYDKIIKFNQLTPQIDQMLDEEIEQDSLDSGCPYLLHIHYQLTLFRDFQDQMMAMAKASSDDVQRTVQKLFGQTIQLIEKFDKLLESLVFDVVELVRAGQISLVIRLFKIIDLEEREDLKIAATRNIIKKKEIELANSLNKKLPKSKNISKFADADTNKVEYPTTDGIYQGIINGSIITRTEIRDYKNFVFDKIRQSIQDMFIEVRKEYQGERRFEVLENLDWIFNELLIVKEHISKYTPAYWKIFDKYFSLYFDELNLLIIELVESEPETLIILDILDFDKTFQQTLIKDFGFSKKETKSIIGDEQKEVLFADYLKLLVTKMNEWIGNLTKAEFDVFLERSTPPHSDSENILFLDGTKTCFQMFTQQVEVAAGSNQAKILVGVVEKFCGLLEQRQRAWIDKLQIEVKRLMNYNELYDIDPQNIPPESECPGGLVEYLTAVANDQMRAADYAVAISTKYGKLVTKAYERSITNNIENTLDGFAEVAKCGSMGIITIIFDDLKKPYEEIFSKCWYTGSQAQQISDTLSEYLSEIKDQMNPFVFSTFIESIVEETILKFLSALHYEHSFKNKNNKYLECMKRDFEIFYKLFIQYVPQDEDKAIIVDDKFKLMEYFMDFSCGPTEEVINTWNKCLGMYWDVPLEFLNSILNCRKDLDKSTTRQLMLEATRVSKNPHRMNEIMNAELPPTFIGRLTL